VGTPRSPAPLDVTRQSFREQAYGLPADIWCTGVLAYELLVGGAPFEAQTKEETYARILNIQPFYPDCFSREAIHFMKLALEKDPDRRPTAPQLLAHPWLRGSISGRSVHASPTAGIVLATSSHGVDRGLSPTTTSSGVVKSRNNVIISAYLTQLQKARPAPSTAATTTASVATTVPCETTPTAAEGPSVVTPLNKATAGPEIPTNFERVKESSKALVPHPDQSVSPADGDTGELIAASYGSEDSTPNQALAVLAMLKHGSPGGIKRTKSRFLADCMKKLGLSALVSKVGRPMSRGGDKGEATPDTVNGRRNSPLGLSR
jgi:serine/threonine protein kinase